MSDRAVVALIHQGLDDLNWKWQAPRLQDWLKQVARVKGDRLYGNATALPGDAAIALATLLDVYYKCDKLLTLELNSNWNHELVKQVAKEFRCTTSDKLPLAAYKRLLEELEGAATWNDIPF